MELDINALAKRGAEERYRELQDELGALQARFGIEQKTGHASGQEVVPATQINTQRKRTPMTASQRRAVAVRMKKYWAKKRRETKKLGAAGGVS